MAQFEAFDDNVEVNGSAILSTLKGMNEDITDLLDQAGITDLTADGWYPQQAWLDVLKAIGQQEGSLMSLVNIGMKIPDTAVWPPDVETVVDALKSIDEAYHMNHRNGEIGYYKAEVVDQNNIRVTCRNPYPSDFDYGIIYRTVQKFAEKSTIFKVRRADRPSRLHGDDECIYNIEIS